MDAPFSQNRASLNFTDQWAERQYAKHFHKLFSHKKRHLFLMIVASVAIQLGFSFGKMKEDDSLGTSQYLKNSLFALVAIISPIINFIAGKRWLKCAVYFQILQIPVFFICSMEIAIVDQK